MKKKQLILALLALLALAALFFWGRDRIHFNFGDFRSQLALANWRGIGIGLACIYLACLFAPPLIVAVGLAESLLSLRARRAASARP